MKTGSFGTPAAYAEAKLAAGRLEHVYRLQRDLKVAVAADEKPHTFDPALVATLENGLAQLQAAAQEPVNHYLQQTYGFEIGDRIELRKSISGRGFPDVAEQMKVVQVRLMANNLGLYLRGVAVKSNGTLGKKTVAFALEGPLTQVRLLASNSA